MTRRIDGDHAERVRTALGEHERGLVLFAARLTGDLAAARDVVQDTFLRLCEQAPEDVPERLAPWLYRVCRNLAVDRIRKESRMSAVSTGVLDATLSASARPDQLAERRDTASRALQVLSQLPTKEQDVLRLRFQHGLSYREIAEVTGLSLSYVGVLVHTGLKSLRARMHVERSTADASAQTSAKTRKGGPR